MSTLQQTTARDPAAGAVYRNLQKAAREAGEVEGRKIEVSIPVDVQRLLEADPTAKARFDRLSYSRQREHLLSIEAAKRADTRQRRIEKMLASLQAT